MRIYIYKHIFICMYTTTYIYVYVYTYIYMYIHIYTYIYIEQIELPAKLLHHFLCSNESNINTYIYMLIYT